ncbi:hypothetical protein MRX96_002257 [Rhipicephalus microplus]
MLVSRKRADLQSSQLLKHVVEAFLFSGMFRRRLDSESVPYLAATFMDKEADDSSVANSQFGEGGFNDSVHYMDGAASDGQQSPSTAFSAAAESDHLSPEEIGAATAEMEATTPPHKVQENLEEPCRNFVSTLHAYGAF